MIIGREKEKEILMNAVRDNESHLVAIYGRRRIGKTYLARQTLGDRFTFQHAGLSDGTLKEQLNAFADSLQEAGLTETAKIESWLEAFHHLKSLIKQSKEKKKVIFIDELSWMDTPKSGLITALENFWNGWASARDDIVLIVSASATSWMLSKVVHNKGGLYNRLTDQIHLEQFSLSECEQYIKSKGIAFNRDNIMQYYMVFGGVPYYWTFIEKGYSVNQNIDRALFAKNAPLKDEFKYLYASIFKNPEPYLKIIKALAGKKTGMTRDEIIDATHINNSGGLSTKLEELLSCGFIRKYNNYGKKRNDSTYQLIDNYTLFYYHFLARTPDDENYWSNQLNQPTVNSWRGLAFEKVCLTHIAKIKQKLGISGVLTEVSSFICRADADKGITGSQIDLLIVRKDQVINLCEMKYSDAEYTVTKSVDTSIRNKINDLSVVTGTHYAIYPTLVTTYGLKENSYSGNIQAVITMDDLF